MYTRLLLALLVVTAYSLIVMAVFNLTSIPEPQWGDSATTLLGLGIGITLVFRNRAAYDRWWEARTLWGQLINEVRNLAIKTAAFAQISVEEQKGFADLLIAFPNALRMHLRGERDPLPTIDETYPEAAAAQHRPGFVSLQIYNYLNRWNRAGVMMASIRMMDLNAIELMRICGSCERIRNTPMVPSYRFLAWGSVVFYSLAAPWIIGIDHGWHAIPLVLLGSYFMITMETIAETIEEPFGQELDDLDLDRYCQTIESFVRETLPKAESADL